MKYDIEALKRKMLVKYPFFGSVVASVDYKENKMMSTAGTDGKTIFYNPNFLESLSVDEQIFLFAHEVCHIAFNHILRSEGKISRIWNIATDAVINAFLKRDGLKMVAGGVDIAEAINYDAEQLYDKLLEEKKQQQGQGNQSQQENDQQNQNSQPQQSQNDAEENQDEQIQSDQGQDSQTQNTEEQKEQNKGAPSLPKDQQENDQQSQDSQSQQSQDDAEENKDEQIQSDQGQDRQTENTEEQKEQGGDDSSMQREQPGNDSSTSESSNQKDELEDLKQDVGHDTHSMWEDAVKKHKEEQNKDNKKESLLDKIFNIDKIEKKEEKTEVEKKQEECDDLGEKNAFKKNLEEKKRELEKLKEAIAKQVLQAGSTTNSDVRTIAEIGRAKPLIDWRYVLREAIKYDVDWSYRNAYIEDGVVSAKLEEQPIPETEIVLDTSGSINEELLKNFLRECKNILQHSRLKVGCFDTKFYGFHEIRTEEDIENMKFEGGGGTDFDVAVNAFSRRVENKIIFTDGEASIPEKAIDAIWIVFGEKRINPRGGKVINVDKESLERLSLSLNDETTKKTR